MKHLLILVATAVLFALTPSPTLAVWGDAASIADSLGQVQTALTDDYFNSISGSDPVVYKMNLVRSIYFSDTLGGTAIAGRTTPLPHYQTGRFQFAPATDASQSDNTYWRAHRPSYFECVLWIQPIGANSTTTRDSTWILSARVFVYDSLAAVLKGVLPDSSHRFIWSGNYDKTGYGISGGLFVSQKDTTSKVWYPLKVTDGAYISVELTDTLGWSTTGLPVTWDNFIVRGLIRFWGR